MLSEDKSSDTATQNMPVEIQQKINMSIAEGMKIIKEASLKYTDVYVNGNFLIEFRNSTIQDIFSEIDKTQIIYFTTKYENLSETHDIMSIDFDFDDKTLRSLFNGYRPIFYNHKDCIFYTKINAFLAQKLSNQ